MQVFGPYRIEGLLGQGGMGTVYRALDTATGRTLALKVLQRVDPRRLQRFEREAQLSAGLDHPGIVKVHGCGAIEGIPFIACELIEGQSFEEACKRASQEQRLGWIRDAARALGYAHRQGVIHRDVKGPNLLVDREGRLKVLDFGLASAQDLERLTRTGQMVGTPTHMAPEQLDGGKAGPPCDVWGLGVELYLALTQRLPFLADSPVALGAKIASADCPRPRSIDPGISKAAEAVVLRALTQDPTQRYPDGDAFADDLDRVLRGERPHAAQRHFPWQPVLLAGALMGLVGGSLAYAVRPVGRPDPVAIVRPQPMSHERPKPTESEAEPAPDPEPAALEDPNAAADAAIPEGMEISKDMVDLAKDAAGDLSPLLAYHTGRRHLKVGQYAEARPFLVAAARAGLPTAQYLLASEILLVEDPEAAAEWARHSSETGYAKGMALYADCLRLGWGVAKGDPDQVFRLYERALARDPKDLSGYVSNVLGRICAERGEYEEAKAWYLKSVGNERDSFPQSLVDLARLAEEQGDQLTLRESANEIKRQARSAAKKKGQGQDSPWRKAWRLSAAELAIYGAGVRQDVDGALEAGAGDMVGVDPAVRLRLARALEAANRHPELVGQLIDEATDPARRPYSVDALAAKRDRAAK